MKIKCDNCGAVYNISEDKLTKEVSKATCRKCKQKIVIRRPDDMADSLEELRAGRGEEDENVVNHEERTVIAVVPELREAAETTSSDDVARSLAKDALGSQAERPVVSPPLEPALKAPPVLRAVPSVPLEPEPPPSPRLEPSPEPRPAPSPPITAETSPSRPSGAIPVPSAAPTPVPQPAPAPYYAASEPTSPPSPPPSQQKLPLLPLGVVSIALVSLLAFIGNGLWGLSKVTAVGFLVALYATLAALLSMGDVLRGQRRVNPAKVFAVPAVICAGLIASLLTVQWDYLPFLHPEFDIVLYVQNAVKPDFRPENFTAIQEKEKTSRGGNRKPPRQTSPGTVTQSAPSPQPQPDVAPTQKPVQVSLLSSGRQAGSVPKDTSLEVARVKLDAEKIGRILNDKTRFCFDRETNNKSLGSVVKFKITMDPQGRYMGGRITEPTDLRGSQLEKCLKDNAAAQYPVFEGTANQDYEHKFMLY